MTGESSERRIITLHRAFAAASFLFAFVLYLLTMQPSISFWDCGEFASAAWALQIPHPPGAPLWTLIGRIGMLIPLFHDPVARYNFLAVLFSAITVMLLYLTLVRVIKIWKPVVRSVSDMLSVNGAALIAAFTFAATDSFWFNALECEVYAFGTFFIALILYLAFVWRGHANEAGNERYLLLIAYLIGLSLGVHQLALLSLFPVFLLMYYAKSKRVTIWGFATTVLVSIVYFIFVYKVILTGLAEWAAKGMGWLSVLIILSLIGGLVFFLRTKRQLAALLTASILLIFLGYSSYVMIFVRASEHPPMNQNDPSNMERLASYINRDQYGGTQFLPRRIKSQRSEHPATWENYSSNFDFFVKYQTNFMFHRYVGWNFIGREDDQNGSGVDFSKTWALPLLFGLLGCIAHFRKDRKSALVFLATFLIMGYLVAWFQNQQDPQPRERDYFYVGAFYIFAAWIGIAASAIIELIAERKQKSPSTFRTPLFASLALFILVPFNQLFGLAGLLTGQPLSKSSRFALYSRHNNFVPFEYAYNILQSCDKNAILFTYGDNDTFPLWCAQDVYGVRRDVRVVQLSLANLFWYIDGLSRTNTWGSEAIQFQTFTQSLLNQPEKRAVNSLPAGVQTIAIALPSTTVRSIISDSTAAGTQANWRLNTRSISDLVVWDIIRSNYTERPIYFAATVPASAELGLAPYLRSEGAALRLTPIRSAQDPSGLGNNINPARFLEWVEHAAQNPVQIPARANDLRSYRDPTAHLLAIDLQYAMTYRAQYMRAANYFLGVRDFKRAREVLDSLEARIPLARVPVDYRYASTLSQLLESVSEFGQAKVCAQVGVKQLEENLKDPEWRETNTTARSLDIDFVLADLEMKAGRFETAEEKFRILQASTVDPQMQAFYSTKLLELDARKSEAAGDWNRANAEFTQLLRAYQNNEGTTKDSIDVSTGLLDLESHRMRTAKAIGSP